jgi:hypothetical protein
MPLPLNNDEFRLLAYLRGYADSSAQHLDPGWVQEQLEFSLSQMQRTARSLAERGLVEFFEWQPSKINLLEHPEVGEGPHMADIRVTEHGWNYFQTPQA